MVASASSLFVEENHAANGIPHLDHVFVIMMENHGFRQIVNDPNAPFANQLANSANSAKAGSE
jgi:phosphatidylinositol-3-phosphatase